MGFLDDALNEAKDAIAAHPDQVSEALDKAGQFADEKTGGKFTSEIDGGLGQAKNALGVEGQQ